jgi:NAD(P)-dependent dehydrogenase (short-subunit alcohol dehydrogenase family)
VQELSGKVAVVTGAASGIGRALADRFAAAGAHLVLADIEPVPLRSAVDELGAAGAEPLAQVCDVSDADDVAALRDAAVERFGTVHVVCLNAGVAGAGGLQWDVPLSGWAWTLGVNVWGVVHGVHAFVPLLVDQNEGHVVMTASMAGVVAPPLMGPYVASKHAVVGLAESLHHDLALRNSNVGATVVCPGWVRTGIMDSERNWIDRFGEPPPTADAAGAATSAAMFREAGRQLVASGIDPGDVADAVLAAVRDRRFWVFTHPEMATAAVKRVADAVDGREPVVGGLV